MVDKLFFLFIITMILTISMSALVLAQQQGNNNSAELNNRVELLKKSKNLSREMKQRPQTSLSLYMTTYHSGDKELNLGAKYENILFNNEISSTLNFNYVLEGIYLEGEEENLAAFLSIKASLNNKMFKPYFGAGAGFVGEADYQAFAGLNLNKNFFVETKFINDENISENGDFYSGVGFKINF